MRSFDGVHASRGAELDALLDQPSNNPFRHRGMPPIKNSVREVYFPGGGGRVGHLPL
jgi:hypothetical protein